MVDRPARSLEVLLAQVNAGWANRSKAADGWIGDAAHRGRKSDHNPNAAGAVCARDFTNDPMHGFESGQFAEGLRVMKDPRLNYLIADGRIAQQPNFVWNKYNGPNKHNHHCHVSVKQSASFYDAISPWVLRDHVAIVVPGVTKLVPPKLSVGTSGRDVAYLQELLNKHGAKIKVDGDFGGRQTKPAVIAFQKAHPPLASDGVVGPYTWDALEGI